MQRILNFIALVLRALIEPKDPVESLTHTGPPPSPPVTAVLTYPTMTFVYLPEGLRQTATPPPSGVRPRVARVIDGDRGPFYDVGTELLVGRDWAKSKGLESCAPRGIWSRVLLTVPCHDFHGYNSAPYELFSAGKRLQLDEVLDKGLGPLRDHKDIERLTVGAAYVRQHPELFIVSGDGREHDRVSGELDRANPERVRRRERALDEHVAALVRADNLRQAEERFATY